MDKINKLYDIIERDYGIVICDNRANNGCFPNYRVEIKIEYMKKHDSLYNMNKMRKKVKINE